MLVFIVIFPSPVSNKKSKDELGQIILQVDMYMVLLNRVQRDVANRAA